MSRIYVVEPGPTGGPGAMGAQILMQALVRAGHSIAHIRLVNRDVPLVVTEIATGERSQPAASDLPAPDAWYISTITVRQWVHLGPLFRRLGLAPLAADRGPDDPLVVFGGQTSYAPEPIVAFADIVALGDGELTGVGIAALLHAGHAKREVMTLLDGVDGYYVPFHHPHGRPRFVRVEQRSYDPVIVRPGEPGQRQAINLEIARGCKSKCAFCPIGWAGGTYREAEKTAVETALAEHAGKRIWTFAPDYSAVSWVGELEAVLDRHGCSPVSRDARIDYTQRHLDRGGQVRDFAFGIEGLSERLRHALAKPLSRDLILDVMGKLSGRVREVKWYMIVGLPGETDADLVEFIDLLTALRGVYDGRLIISPTPLQSVPHTPLQWIDNHYSEGGGRRAVAIRDTLRSWWQADNSLHWTCYVASHRELHEHSAFLQRMDQRAAAYLLALDGHESRIQSGRWRQHASSLGIDVDAVLDAIPAGAETPWSHVEVGMPPDRVRAGWERYQRVMGVAAA